MMNQANNKENPEGTEKFIDYDYIEGGQSSWLVAMIPQILLIGIMVLLAVLFMGKALGLGDGPAAIASLIATATYYILLYVLRRVIERKIKFTIIKE